MSNYQTIPDIWSSLEFECWSRDFDYDDYKKHGGRLTKDQYSDICSVFTFWMEEEIGEARRITGVR